MKQSSFYRLILSSVAAFLSIALCTGMFSAPAHAQTAGFSLRQASGTQGHVTIIVLDMSGSMAQNDPNGLRCSAANAYIDLSGPGDFIGVIGLDNNTGARGGPHNFQLAQGWTQPTEMATLSERQHLQNTIAQRSDHCRPDNTTPTYDALNQALTMLGSATQGGKIPGSVILLTDGTPSPDTQGQINAINSELLPQFQAHNWQVDTVALGQDGPIGGGMSGTFHSFLSGIANATSGKFYDDGNGIVPGVSALNIAPFFVNIFALRNGRTVGPTIAPTPLTGGTTSRDFQLGNYVDHLDVIVVKDQPSTQVTLTTSNKQTLPPQVAGTFVSTFDPYYAIFSVDGPQPGDWQVNVKGSSGQFLMDSLTVSSLKMSLVAPSTKPVLPLGQAFTVAATIDYQGNAVSGGQFSVTGTVSYSGSAPEGSVPYTGQIVLTDNASPGLYQAKVTVPESAAPGSYEITVSASQVSNVAISSAHQSIRLESFPLPFFFASAQSHQVTESTVNATAIQWDPVIAFLYGLPIGPVQWLSQKPLGGLPAQANAVASGEVQLNGTAYQNAAVTATATRAGTHATIPVTVINNGNGLFHVQFPSPKNGLYTVTFRTGGSFADTHGDFGTTTRSVELSIQPASPGQELVAWIWTVVYLLILCLIWRMFRFFITPPLSGQWVKSEDGDVVAHHFFNQSRRNPFGAFFRRNLLYSEDAGMPPGLQFRFNRGDSIEVRAHGSSASYWKRDGREVQGLFQDVRQLAYSPSGGYDSYEDEDVANNSDGEDGGTYIILTRNEQTTSFGGQENEPGTSFY